MIVAEQAFVVAPIALYKTKAEKKKHNNEKFQLIDCRLFFTFHTGASMHMYIMCMGSRVFHSFLYFAKEYVETLVLIADLGIPMGC